MATIRPYRKSDFRYVQDICLENSRYAAEQTPANRALLCAMSCDYYLDEEPQFCFVAADEDDVPIGCILCAADFANFHEVYTEQYLPFVRRLSSTEYFRCAAEVKAGEHNARLGYTAHMQIAVLPEFQRRGVGTELLHALLDKLHEMFVEGVYVVVGSKNDDAKQFFAKEGFDDIDYITGSVLFGKKLYTEDEQ